MRYQFISAICAVSMLVAIVAAYDTSDATDLDVGELSEMTILSAPVDELCIRVLGNTDNARELVTLLVNEHKFKIEPVQEYPSENILIVTHPDIDYEALYSKLCSGITIVTYKTNIDWSLLQSSMSYSLDATVNALRLVECGSDCYGCICESDGEALERLLNWAGFSDDPYDQTITDNFNELRLSMQEDFQIPHNTW